MRQLSREAFETDAAVDFMESGSREMVVRLKFI
jgi:hypothetical protein